MKTLEMKNKTNHDFGLKIRGEGGGSIRPLTTTRDDDYVKIPGRHGGTLNPGTLQMSYFTVNFVYYNDERDWLDKRASIARWLDSDNEVEIRVDDEPGVYYLGKVTGYDSPNLEAGVVSFSVEFTVQPFRFSEIKLIDSPTTNTINIDNTGNYESPYVLRYTAMSPSSFLDINVNGTSIKYNSSLQNGDDLSVDTVSYEVRLNGELKVVEITGFFEPLKPGDNTIIVSTPGRLSVEYQELFV